MIIIQNVVAITNITKLFKMGLLRFHVCAKAINNTFFNRNILVE